MTTTASKSGLRANATAKREKAAQRTPLPPKGKAEKISLAREAVEETKTKTKTKPRKASAKEETPAKAGKGEHYAILLRQAGWKPEVVRQDGLVELTAIRGVEALFLSWFNEAHISGGSTYTYADRTIKVRNPAEAMRIAAVTPEAAKASQTRVASNRQFVKRATGPTVRNVPFDVETATDEEIIAALSGHRVTWHNQYRVESETAIVGSAEGMHISRHAKGHRIVSFVDPETGYRALKLENLENVGHKVNLDRIRQDILVSRTREAKRAERRAA